MSSLQQFLVFILDPAIYIKWSMVRIPLPFIQCFLLLKHATTLPSIERRVRIIASLNSLLLYLLCWQLFLLILIIEIWW